MAVEAHQVDLFPSKAIVNRGFAGVGGGGGGGAVHAFGYGVVPRTAVETPVPSSALTNAVKSDSGLTHAAAVVSRKRQRYDDVVGDVLPASSPPPFIFNVQNHHHQINNIRRPPFTFLGEDISLHLHQQQLDLDRFIAQQTEKARIEIYDRRRSLPRRRTIDESPLIKKLKAKEEELEKIGKLNSLLEERVNSLRLENQIWRDLAQTNEAAANALRSNLEQVLAQAKLDQLADDAQSCCASNSNEEDKGIEFNSSYSNTAKAAAAICRSCGGEESSVLLLPCRHLCLCTACGSTVHTCPVCHSSKTASLHVNLSSS